MGDVRTILPRPVLGVIAGPVLAAVVLHLAFVARYVVRYGGSLDVLLCVSTDRAGRPPWELIPRGFGRTGYDGQDYYAIARAPWRTELRLRRQLRILYPAVCWLLSGGDRHLLFWVMPGVNLAAIGALAGLGAWLADRRGLSPWWGFVLPLGVAAGLPALRDLTDVVSSLALCALLAAVLTRARGWVVALAAAAAVFGREQNAAVVVLLIGTSLWAGRWRLAAGAAGVLVLWAVWVGVLWHGIGKSPFLSGEGAFATPLAGLRFGLAQLAGKTGDGRALAVSLLTLGHLALQIILALGAAARGREPLVRLVALLGVTLAVTAGPTIYADVWSYARVLTWLPVGIWFHGVETRQRWVLACLAPGVLGTLAALRGVI